MLPERGGTSHESRKRNIMSTSQNVRLREEAAAKCTAKIKKEVLKQARKARAEHLVK